jgi:hypothetical protein
MYSGMEHYNFEQFNEDIEVGLFRDLKNPSIHDKNFRDEIFIINMNPEILNSRDAIVKSDIDEVALNQLKIRVAASSLISIIIDHNTFRVDGVVIQYGFRFDNEDHINPEYEYLHDPQFTNLDLFREHY